MKIQKQNLRTSLGYTQNEMALMLGVSRSLYSLYELGRRSLPHAAAMLEMEMVLHFHSGDAGAKIKAKAPMQKPVSRKHIERLLQFNHLQKVKLEKKLEAMRTRIDVAFRQAHLGDLADKNDKAFSDWAKRHIKTGAALALSEYKTAALFDLELRQKVLAFEQDLLQQALESAPKKNA